MHSMRPCSDSKGICKYTIFWGIFFVFFSKHGRTIVHPQSKSIFDCFCVPLSQGMWPCGQTVAVWGHPLIDARWTVWENAASACSLPTSHCSIQDKKDYKLTNLLLLSMAVSLYMWSTSGRKLQRILFFVQIQNEAAACYQYCSALLMIFMHIHLVIYGIYFSAQMEGNQYKL